MGRHSRQQPASRTKRILGGAAAATGLGLAAAAVLAPPAAGASALPVSYSASGWQHGRVRPATVSFGAGGSLFIRSIRWHSWGPGAAAGHGIQWADGCLPTCAQGTYLRSAVSLTLSQPRWHGSHRYFSRLAVRWTTRDGVRHVRAYRWGNPYGAPVPLWY